jgi:hypothetical protein
VGERVGGRERDKESERKPKSRIFMDRKYTRGSSREEH